MRNDTAIVIQGPLVHRDDFTVETVNLYRTNFPEAPIVVSTWTSEEGPTVDRLQRAGAVVLTQFPPENPGISNVNLQIASVSAALKYSASLGVTHVLRTRSDQRLYAETALGFLHALSASFPLDAIHQRERIIGTSLNTFAYRMYGLSDMLMFGTVEDMSRYWIRTLDPRPSDTKVVASSHRQAALQKVPEVALCSDFLRTTGWPLEWTLLDSWRAFAHRFLVLDSHSLDLYWPKYSSNERRWRTYDGDPRSAEIDFSLWLMMLHGRTNPDEAILDAVIW